MTICRYVRKNCDGWEFGSIKVTLDEKKKEVRQYQAAGHAPSYEEACLANTMVVEGMGRQGYNHINERGVVVR